MGIFSRRKKSDEPADAAPIEPVVTALDDADQEFIDAHLRVLEGKAVNLLDAVAIGELYDELFGNWAAVPEAERRDPAGPINLVAIALGEHLVRATSLQWMITTDAWGVGYALVDADSGWTMYPVDAVTKRWGDGEEGSFIPAFVGWMIAKTSGPQPTTN